MLLKLKDLGTGSGYPSWETQIKSAPWLLPAGGGVPPPPQVMAVNSLPRETQLPPLQSLLIGSASLSAVPSS